MYCIALTPDLFVLVLQMREQVGLDDTTPHGKYDDQNYESEFEYDSDASDVTTGWESDGNSLSSDEGMIATAWYPYAPSAIGARTVEKTQVLQN